jgi:hypothetical protein
LICISNIESEICKMFECSCYFEISCQSKHRSYIDTPINLHPMWQITIVGKPALIVRFDTIQCFLMPRLRWTHAK